MKKHSPGFLAMVNAAKSRVRECTAVEVIAQVHGGDSPLLIDVREESEFSAGHIKGSLWLGKGILERDIEQRVPDVDAEIVLYCGGGYRSALAADALQQMGYRQVSSMAGGWRAWNDASGPTEGPA